MSGLAGNVGRVGLRRIQGRAGDADQGDGGRARELDIRVNAIAPGPVETPLVAQMHTPRPRAVEPDRADGRYGTPDEIAGVAAFLLDPDFSSYVTGQTIAVDGGFMAAGIISRQE